ncbi:dihydrofolate reductase family protein [Paramicrobacterium chengjingii]|uniref:Dihydrofolate reductase n=1 Tax=Paramicrobacterium chengjingii TaxID=2769067 RepID=A0ABX6YJU0_9MICO|nr:dihydrofolate reductase family protein [Microbacterium chengjingii]QPZ38869.1 dihydrofolate reductase [Microbacterium chengjingii]
MTTHYYTASSLDGFIATPENSLDWLLKQDIDLDGPMAYPAFIQRMGAIAMGATTYEAIHAEEDEDGWPYTRPSWVFTHRTLSASEGADVRFVQGEVRAVHEEMTAAVPGKDLWVMGGGELAGQFADAGLLDEVWVQYAPVMLGAGAPLFPRALDLELIDTARNKAFLCGRFRVKGAL